MIVSKNGEPAGGRTLTEHEQNDLLRRAAVENAIASGEMEGLHFTPAMRDLLDRKSRDEMTTEEFDRAVLALARDC